MPDIDDITVHSPAGTIVGRRTGRARRFLGIPYAEAPTGARRFAPPVRRGRFTEPFDASRHGATSRRVPLSATRAGATGGPGDPAREYGSALAVDTTGAYDPAIPAVRESC